MEVDSLVSVANYFLNLHKSATMTKVNMASKSIKKAVRENKRVSKWDSFFSYGIIVLYDDNLSKFMIVAIYPLLV